MARVTKKKGRVVKKRPALKPEVSSSEPGEFPAGYKIIMGANAGDLANAVALAMRQGWLPVGGVCHVPTDPMAFAMVAQGGKPPNPYWQAMVRAV